MRFRADIARTLGDLLLDHLYTKAGGDGRSLVTLHPERAACLLGGGPRASRAEVSVLRDMLQVLATEKPRAYSVQASSHATGHFDIQPLRSDSP